MTELAQRHELGRRLREAREARGYNQTQAAERGRISRTIWQQLEKGERFDGKPFEPKVNTVIAAAQAVELDPRELLPLAGHDPSHFEPTGSSRPSVSERELAERISRLTQKQRRAVSDVVDAMLEPGGKAGPIDIVRTEGMNVVVATDESSPKFVEERPGAERSRKP